MVSTFKKAALSVSFLFSLHFPNSVIAQQCESTQVAVGYRTFSYAGSELSGYPTEEKPESKLWWNDGSWWGVLWDPELTVHRIHRFDVTGQCWTSVGPNVDDRDKSSVDVLWDPSQQKLYMSSRAKENHSGPSDVWFLRFSYNAGPQTYSLDNGFPVSIHDQKSETFVIAKDSNGKLWATWEEGKDIMINRTVGSDDVWGTPFVLPVQGDKVDDDDISSIIAFGGNKIGVMWSNHAERAMFFAIHSDDDEDTSWQPREAALMDETLGSVADDHINLAKSNTDGGQTVVAITKTSLSAVGDPLIFLLRRDSNGTWSRHEFGRVEDNHTRPIVLVNSENDSVYVISKAKTTPVKGYLKRTHMDNPQFDPGLGELFLSSSLDDNMNNPTTTKQFVNSQTGLLVLVSDKSSKNYLHNYLQLPSVVPVVESFTPAIGAIGMEVTIVGPELFTSTTAVSFNGISAASFTIDSDTQLRATVPAAARTGRITLTNAEGTSTSADPFTVVLTPQVSTFTPTEGPVTSYVTINGDHFTQVTAVSFNGEPAGTFTVDSENQITAQVASGTTTGAIAVTNLAGTGVSASNFVITGLPNILSVTPSSGLVGSEVTVTGVNFGSTNDVAVNGVSATFTVDSDSALRLEVPAGATVGRIAVTNGAGAVQSQDDFAVILHPTISSFTPDPGYEGLEITLTGSNFIEIDDVTFSGISATSFTVDSQTQLRAIVPVTANTGPVGVTNAAGAAFSAQSLTIIDPPVFKTFAAAHDARVWSANPTTNYGSSSNLRARETSTSTINTFLKFDVTSLGGTVGAATLRLFVADASNDGGSLFPVSNEYQGTNTPWTEDGLIWDNAPAISGPSLDSAGGVSTGEMVEFDVTSEITADGMFSFGLQSGSSDAVKYHAKEGSNPPELVLMVFQSDVPTITSFLPTSVRDGEEVTVLGTTFTGASDVLFNGLPAVSFTVDSDLQLRAVVPVGASDGRIHVANAQGVGISPSNFQIISHPTVSSFAPSMGIIGTQVTLQGNNFIGVTDVTFNDTSASSYIVDSESQIRVDVPSGATTGRIRVVNSNGPGQSLSDFTVILSPVVSGFNPVTGEVGTEVTVTGHGFSGATDVTFDELSANFTLDSDTQLRAGVPANATNGLVGVVNAAGSAASVDSFQVLYPPVVTSFTPTQGIPETEVTITGSNFTFAAEIGFNGTPASNFIVDSDTLVRATVSLGTTTGKIAITNVDGTGLSNDDFVVVQPPTVTSFDPPFGPEGTEVVILGTNFTHVTEVSFNGIPASSFAIDSDGQIRVTVANGASTGPINISNAAGVAQSTSNFSVTPPPSTFTFNPSDDAFVRSTEPDKNYGDEDELRVRLSSSDYDSYLKFQVTGLIGTVVSAQIRLFVIDGSLSGGDTYQVSNDYAGTSTPWQEMGLIWNNAPAITGGPLSSLAAVTLGDTVDFDVTSAITGNGTFSFAITGDISDAAKYDSKEGAVAPRLVVEVLNSPIPSISSLNPASGPVGAEVTVMGFNFTGTTDVAFNGLSAASFTVDSNTLLRAQVPAGAATGKISVTNPDGTGDSGSDFSVIDPPLVTSFSPPSGAIGSFVTLTGSGFSEASDVTFNGTAASTFTIESDSEMRAQVPAGAVTGGISVSNSAGTGISSSDFTVVFVPSLSSFTPTTGTSSTEVTVTGVNFTGATEVVFNGVPASTFTVDADSVLRVNVPAGATTGSVSVTNGDGTGHSASDFTILQPPVVTGFNPASGAVGSLVTLSGSGLSGASDIDFNGTSASTFTIESDSEIRVQVPAGAVTGAISVTNSIGTGFSAEDFVLIFPASIGSMIPNSGPAGTEVTITGTSFSTATQITFNATLASVFAIDSDTQIRVQVPSGATTGLVSVTNVAGTGSSSSDFTVTFIPSISSFTPQKGALGTEVTVSGVNFTTVTAVDFNGVSASSFTVDADSELRTQVPAGATTGLISVTNGDGSAESATDFTVIEAPTITSFSPTEGPVGTEVTVLGSHFDHVTEVLFNGISATGLTIDSDNQLRARVAAGSSSGAIRVTNAAGSGVSLADFNVTAPPSELIFIPTDDAFVRSTDPTRNNGDVDELRVRLSSTDYDGYLKFDVFGIIGSVVSAKLRLLVIDGSSEGGELYMVSNNYASNGTPWDELGLIWDNAPAISGTPLSSVGSVAVGDTVEFDVTSAISEDGIYSFALTNSTSDAVKYAPKEGVVAPRLEIRLFNEVIPAIGSFSPASGGIGTPVTISGSGFTGVTGVLFDGVPVAGFSVDSDSQIETQVPAGATTGVISVINGTGTGTSSGDFTVTFMPLVTNFSPNSGIAGTEVTVTGSNFTGITDVSFNGLSTGTLTVDSNTQLRAEVPASASTGKISVTNGDGSGQSDDDFVIIAAPSIASFSPGSGPLGSEVTITGADLSLVSDVSFDGTSATTFSIDSDTQIRVQVPSGATTGSVSVTNVAGTGSSSSDFTVTFIPSISSFTPPKGALGTEVTVSGVNFTTVAAVDFNGVSASSFTVDADSELRAQVPAGATTGLISVTNGDGSAESATDFTVIEAPTITSFSPTEGPVGTEVTVLGSHFDHVTEVLFNGISATGLTIDSDNQLRARVAAGSSSGAVMVTNAAGSGVSLADFNVTAPPSEPIFTPTDDAFVRSTEPTRNHGDVDELRVRQSSADYDTYLKFNISGTIGSVVSAKLRLLVIDGSSEGGDLYLVSNNYKSTGTPWDEMGLIWFNAPAISGAPLGSMGSVAVGDTVEFDVSSAISGDGIYSFALTNNTPDAVKYAPKEGVVAPRLELELFNDVIPAISSFSPASAPVGTEVTISGSNLSGMTEVRFNGIAASFILDSDTQVRADVPAGSQSGKISVTTPDGTSQSSNDFIVIHSPMVSSFTPVVGSIGTEVTVSGSGFTGATDVLFNEISATTFSLDSDTQLRVTVPTGATTGSVSVVNVAGAGSSSNDFTATFLPLISSFTPALGAIGVEVTITGVNFGGATDVNFDGVSASSFTPDSNTQLRVQVPATATTGKISVTNPDGTGQSGDDFVVVQAPDIVSFTPTSGPSGTEVTVTGSNLSSVTSVTFNGSPASALAIDSESQLRATAPAGLTSGPIIVVNPAGGATSASDFTVDQPSSLTFNPTDDSFVRSSKPNHNYATAEELRVRKTTSSDIVSYLKFNITGISGSLASAKIRLKVIDAGGDGGEMHSVSNNYAGTSDPWNEDGLVWGNAPEVTGSPLSNIGTVNLEEVVEYDVTQAISGNGIYSFAIKNNSSDAVKYSSNEGAIAPELVMEFGSESSAKANDAKDVPAADSNEESAEIAAMAHRLVLRPIYSNPFNIETTIEYSVPKTGMVHLAIYNIRGQEVRNLVDQYQNAGLKKVRWDGRNKSNYEVGTGAYFVRLKFDDKSLTRIITLQK